MVLGLSLIIIICSDCNLTFAVSDSYMHHLRKIHSDRDKHMYTCSVCRFQSPVLNQLAIHLEGNHEECLRYPCQVCTSKFSTSKRRINHELKKHQTKNCPYCNKSIPTARYNDHLNLHTGKLWYIFAWYDYGEKLLNPKFLKTKLDNSKMYIVQYYLNFKSELWK